MSQHCGEPLSTFIGTNKFSTDDVKKIAFQILSALSFLHERKFIHRNLSPENILLQMNKDIKLFNYGLYHMTESGKLVSFPIM